MNNKDFDGLHSHKKDILTLKWSKFFILCRIISGGSRVIIIRIINNKFTFIVRMFHVVSVHLPKTINTNYT